jgi:hypothetical protein
MPVRDAVREPGGRCGPRLLLVVMHPKTSEVLETSEVLFPSRIFL